MGEIDNNIVLMKRGRKFYINGDTINGLNDLLEKYNVTYKEGIEFVYLLKSKYGYKIGRSKNVHSRLRLFNVKLPFEFEVMGVIPTYDSILLEKKFHAHFLDKRLNGEWFALNGKDLLFWQQVSEVIYKDVFEKY